MDQAPDLDAEAAKIVADAEAAAREAEGLLDELERRVESGDAGVTRDEVEAAEKNRNWLQKLIVGAKTRAEDLREQNRLAKLTNLRDRVLAEAPADGAGLLAQLQALRAASLEVVKLADKASADTRGWVSEALALDVPDKGVISPAHAGLGVSAAGDVLVDDVVVRPVDAKSLFRLLFFEVQNGFLPTPDESSVLAAFDIARDMGKATK
ncbi:hypothetical protein [Leifsonia naganoensis]|uniref:Uncharacterized protein n=1 Tax=Leifsonia naganoensis TaxID=150025 RepID=A0A853DPV1_9MICO|nr:hypothetical protein [Leifsonia naganoensis]NYK08574.1 hypothetical protein [Leifsonia naganoensis]